MALIIQRALGRLSRTCTSHVTRLFHDEFSAPEPLNPKQPAKNQAQNVPSAGSIANKYQIFRDADATVILDVEEERQLQLQREQQGVTRENEEESEDSKALPSIFNGINLERELCNLFLLCTQMLNVTIFRRENGCL